MQRVAIVGTSGSGKTTMAARIAARIGCPHVELDSLFWEPGWQEAETEVFRDRVRAALAGDTWTVDGNYRKARDIIWGRADTVVWLDYALPVVMWRLVKRTLKRAATREVLWAGNRENLWEHFFTRQSLFLWALQTHGRHRREYPEYLARPEFAHLTLVRLVSPRAADKWVVSFDLTAPLQYN